MATGKTEKETGSQEIDFEEAKWHELTYYLLT
jgi:hypothetical protein